MGLPTAYQDIIHLSRYSRWNELAQRRESWEETPQRYISFMQEHLQDNFGIDSNDPIFGTAYRAIFKTEVMPSMRCMMSAGKALQREPLCGFNCTYRAVDDLRAFDEIMYILMCGCGVGFSVERQFTGKLPMIARRFKDVGHVITVADSRTGWCEAFRNLLLHLVDGEVPSWDVSRVRKAGARLKTMGGTASGPAPLVELFKFTVHTFKEAAGRRLSSLECHDIVCKIGDIVVVGGVRRSALISLSNPSDMRLRHAKAGDWRRVAPWRELANNSAAYTEPPTTGAFMAEWLSLYESKSGERGFFSRVAAIEKCRSIGRKVDWDNGEDDPIDFGTNPCGEIILRSQQTCNLTEVVARDHDNFDSLARKVQMSAILGTWQSTLTRFGYVNEKWRKNCEEERLLGASITGIMDSPILNGSKSDTDMTFRELRRIARQTNKEWAERLGIPPSAAITCVKPSGTVSLLVNSSSGIHARFAKQYIRRVAFDLNDPVAQVIKAQGFQWEPHATKPQYMIVFKFPMRAPDNCIVDGDRSAIETLDHWRMVRENWCDHNPSTTINVEEHEWPAVGGYVFDHFKEVGGLAFMPSSDTMYTQAPLEKVTESQLEELESATPKSIDWTQLEQLERTDRTETARELACVGDACEVRL